MTIAEKYYEINRRLSVYLKAQGVTCPVVKYGVDFATLEKDPQITKQTKYPYIQTYFTNEKRQSWTSRAKGTLTDFDFQLSYFVGVRTEADKDAALFRPFEIAMNALSDVNINLLSGVASILSTDVTGEVAMKAGMLVPARLVVYRMRTTTTYEADVPAATISTDYESGINLG